MAVREEKAQQVIEEFYPDDSQDSDSANRPPVERVIKLSNKLEAKLAK